MRRPGVMGKETRGKPGGIFLYSGNVICQFLYILQQSQKQTAATGARNDGCRAGGPYPQRRADAHLLSEWPTCLLNAVNEKNKFQ